MERNADGFSGGSTGGGYGNTGDVTGSAGYGAGTSGSGSTAGSSASTDENASGLTDRARDIAGTAKDKLADVGTSVRQGAGTAKDRLADVLESGADKLRQRGGRGQLSGSTGSGDVAITGDGSMTQVTDKLAGGMQATADWLRDADLDNLRSGVERQVKEHPGRTLLIAVGVGYLLGKAFRK
jgi:ElaB/YqjD/DUF883 family membrane-anchored ribosome-binding protein